MDATRPNPELPAVTVTAAGAPFEPQALTSHTAALFADMPAVELGDAPAVALNLTPGPPRGPVDIGELHAAAEGGGAIDLRADPNWQGSALTSLAGQFPTGRVTQTHATRSLPGVFTRPPRPAGR